MSSDERVSLSEERLAEIVAAIGQQPHDTTAFGHCLEEIISDLRPRALECDDEFERAFNERSAAKPNLMKALKQAARASSDLVGTIKRNAGVKLALRHEAAQLPGASAQFPSTLESLERLHVWITSALDREGARERRGRKAGTNEDVALLQLAETYCEFFDPGREPWSLGATPHSRFIRFATCVLKDTLGPHGLEEKLSVRWRRLRNHIKPAVMVSRTK